MKEVKRRNEKVYEERKREEIRDKMRIYEMG